MYRYSFGNSSIIFCSRYQIYPSGEQVHIIDAYPVLYARGYYLLCKLENLSVRATLDIAYKTNLHDKFYHGQNNIQIQSLSFQDVKQYITTLEILYWGAASSWQGDALKGDSSRCFVLGATGRSPELASAPPRVYRAANIIKGNLVLFDPCLRLFCWNWAHL